MRKFGSIGLKILKMLHILMIVLFLGGILSSFALLMKLDLSNYEDVYMNYKIFSILSDNVVVKMLGLGLAVSVLVDATIVRLLLVPAVMTLLGAHAWWLPRWLDKILPHIDIEGGSTPAAGAGQRKPVPVGR